MQRAGPAPGPDGLTLSRRPLFICTHAQPSPSPTSATSAHVPYTITYPPIVAALSHLFSVTPDLSHPLSHPCCHPCCRRAVGAAHHTRTQAVWGRADVLPCRAYLRHCVLAAASLGPEAERSFLHATYLADRCVCVSVCVLCVVCVCVCVCVC